MHNRTESKLVAVEYPLDILNRHSTRVRRSYPVNKLSGLLSIATTNSLEPNIVGLDIVLRWLRDFPAEGFSPNFRGEPQLSAEMASMYARGNRISFNDALRIQEAIIRLDLRGPLSRQYVLQNQIKEYIAIQPITADDFIMLWHIFKELDPNFAKEAVNKMADHMWAADNKDANLILVWCRCTEDQLLHEEIVKAWFDIQQRIYNEKVENEKSQDLTDAEKDKISGTVAGELGAKATGVSGTCSRDGLVGSTAAYGDMTDDESCDMSLETPPGTP
jgi:hypothetical protein